MEPRPERRGASAQRWGFRGPRSENRHKCSQRTRRRKRDLPASQRTEVGVDIGCGHGEECLIRRSPGWSGGRRGPQAPRAAPPTANPRPASRVWAPDVGDAERKVLEAESGFSRRVLGACACRGAEAQHGVGAETRGSEGLTGRAGGGWTLPRRPRRHAGPVACVGAPRRPGGPGKDGTFLDRRVPFPWSAGSGHVPGGSGLGELSDLAVTGRNAFVHLDTVPLA